MKVGKETEELKFKWGGGMGLLGGRGSCRDWLEWLSPF
jgi:hypothetical protein